MSETSEVLRRAAGLMRERAEAASPAPWRNEPGSVGRRADGKPWPSNYVAHSANLPRFKVHSVADAEHIASWHPAVALAVADWLEEAADHLDVDLSDESLDICPTAREGAECSVVGQAVTVARAYLGADQ
jgi:hypothetical protein